LRKKLDNTTLKDVKTLAELQSIMGIKIRSGVLIWRAINMLREQAQQPYLTLSEIQIYLLRCSTHQDIPDAVTDLMQARNSLSKTTPLMPIGVKRDIQEWARLLAATSIFKYEKNIESITQSPYGLKISNEISSICDELEKPDSFWNASSFDRSDFLSWYAQFGEINLGINLISTPELLSKNTDVLNQEFVVGREIDSDKGLESDSTSRIINLRNFDPAALLSLENGNTLPTGTTIESSYDAALADKAHRTHDSMVILIANVCRTKGAIVMDDPKSVDLLVEFDYEEFLIEVKSVTPNNFVSQLRYAIGQVLQYDYLRSNQSSLPRRRIIAVAAQVPDNFWCIPFLNNHLDMDLLSLEGRNLKVSSSSPSVNNLFTPF